MIKDQRVLVLDPDPFARNWMAMLLARDWRTHLVGEAASIADLAVQIREAKPRVDILIIEAELIAIDQDFQAFQKAISPLPHVPLVVLVGMKSDERVLKRLQAPNIMGYLLKNEIGYSLAWAAAIVSTGPWIVTPAIQDAIFKFGATPTGKGLVLDGRSPVANLTARETEAARMAFMFSLERHDLADELNISKDWSYGLVSTLYKKLGMDEVLEGEVDPAAYLGKDELVMAHLRDIVAQLHGSPKARDIETLAYHIFTLPEIEVF